jgi:5''-3'' exonuclease (including N-terminal domain of PolI)
VIVVDYNQTAISSLMVNLGGRRDVEVNVPLVRHMIINALRSYRKKFGPEFGEMVIACDNRHYWRRQYFPNYKANRKKSRADSGFDWNSIFEALHLVRAELAEHFPYAVIDVDGAEADDVIAVLAEYSQTMNTDGLIPSAEPFLVLSGDHDFNQLQKWSNVKQYAPVQKKFIKLAETPEAVLMEHIIMGDKGDGVPNILSGDDTFVNGDRQRPIRKDALALWKTQKPEDFITNDEMWRNFQRNRELVDLSRIPEEIKESIIDNYEMQKQGDRSGLLNYFIANRMTQLIELVDEF